MTCASGRKRFVFSGSERDSYVWMGAAAFDLFWAFPKHSGTAKFGKSVPVNLHASSSWMSLEATAEGPQPVSDQRRGCNAPEQSCWHALGSHA